jgi:hypothetical protein
MLCRIFNVLYLALAFIGAKLPRRIGILVTIIKEMIKKIKEN